MNKNERLDKVLKNTVRNEFNQRRLFDQDNLIIKTNLSKKIKIKIIFFGLFYFIKIVKLSSQEYFHCGKKNYKTYWKYLNISIILYIILFLVISKYCIKPFFYES